MHSHYLSRRREQAGTAVPRGEPLKWEVWSNESNTQPPMTRRQLYSGHVTTGAFRVSFFSWSMAERVGEAREAHGGWVLPTLTIVLSCLDSVCRFQNDNVFAGNTLLVTLCHFRECLRWFRAAPLQVTTCQHVPLGKLLQCWSGDTRRVSLFIHLLTPYLFIHSSVYC